MAPVSLKLNNKNLTRAAIFDLLQTVRDELVKKKSNAEKNKIEAMRIEEERKAKESANKNAKKKSQTPWLQKTVTIKKSEQSNPKPMITYSRLKNLKIKKKT